MEYGIIEYQMMAKEVCLILEKEKNVSNIVFTNMSELSRKVKMESTPKDISYIISKLENQGVIKTLKKNNRQTVLEIKQDLLYTNIDLDFDINKERNIEDIKISITPKRLLEYIRSRVDNNNSLIINSKELCNEFACLFDKVKLVLDALQRTEKIQYNFSAGVFYIDLIEDNNIEDNNIDESKEIENIGNITFDSSNTDVDAIFDEIGTAMQEFFDEHRNLKKTVDELSKKLEIATIANEQLRKNLNEAEMHCKQMQERNNRLYNDIISLRTGIH